MTFDESLRRRRDGADDDAGARRGARRARAVEPAQAQMVESRFFGGLDVAETAELLGVSEATVLRDWRAAKAWLARELATR